MTTEEAFVKVLQMHGIDQAFGIIGSAMMPVSDLFPKAGITFWDCAHEANAGIICDGYSRATGRMAMAIAQNGPGVTGFVTAIKTAYWNHTPMLLVTPQAANRTMGQGGFQEVPQMALFQDMVCYQEEVREASRIPEVLNRVIEKALRGGAPAQINVPRDFWTQVIDVELPQIVKLERPSGGKEAIAAAEDLGWDVVLKGTGDRHRNRPDLAHVRRELATPADMEAAWRSLSKLINPETVQLVVQKMAPRGVPVQISSLEDPSFGPVVSFGIGGQMTELLNDYAYRIPPLSEQDAADMVREIKSAPLLFGYRGMEVADVGAIERLITCVARIQYDFPQVRSLSLPLVLAGPRGASVLTSAVRIEPVADPRSDWFVRRLSAPLGDTAPG